ncbi:MAG: DUF3644 domain-containing protein [Pseudomonadota bacterium]
MVKAMLATRRYNDQDVLAYFTRPTRSINHRAIAEIRTEAKHRAIRIATEAQLDDFLTNWPDVDPETGLSRRGDELLLKAREAMIAAVHCFNGGGLTFRAELFITTTVIAWTYLMHAWFKREGIDYRHRRAGNVETTPGGADKYWELGKCLRHARSPLAPGVRLNLEFLLEIRHEIEHRSTNRIDDALGAKLQACCLNFNDAIRSLFGDQYGLERRLPIALQFVTFRSDQLTALKSAAALPANVSATMDAFDHRLTDEQRADPAFGYRVAFVPKVGSKASKADLAIEFVKPGTEEAKEISRVLLKEVDKARYTASQVVERMHQEGFPRFNLASHTALWQALQAKDPAKGFGRPGDYANTWVWFDSWTARVRAHCQEQGVRYLPIGAPGSTVA